MSRAVPHPRIRIPGARGGLQAGLLVCALAFGTGQGGSDAPRAEVCAGGEGTCSGAAETAVKIRAFEEWLAENELAVNFLRVESMPVFRMGTTATRDLEEKELYVAVPDKMLIGPERVGPGSKLQKRLDEIAQKHGGFGRLVDDRVKLIMFLLREARGSRKKPSFWKPYIDLLPQNLSNPFLWPEEDLAYLQASEVADAARRERQKLRAEYDQLRSKIFAHDRSMFPKDAFSLKKWLWGCALYDSRVIQLNRHTGQGNTPTWIPLVDMVNCIESQDKTFIQYDTSLRAAVMYADRYTPRGTQVFESYGNKSNYEYLLYNGFVMRDNPNDCVYVSLSDPRGPEPGKPGPRPSRQVCLGSQAVPRLAQQWAQVASGSTGPAGAGAGGESKQALLRLLRERLARYGSGLPDDEQLLERLAALAPVPERQVLAVQMRMHEKHTLSRLVAGLESGDVACCG